ncbi:uncharacterized protein LOC105274644 isoform X2 [Ooceraea biroi]|uniref:uncharacterized protein LOC105274644 isoform X2 n=1 Tax=Ooceraea biroi TaxID=2015173 RepID=UPI0009716F4F|nr:uncharacterized protein LOC105274644 isoform X2 [Ooceraea biroi]
MSTPGVRVKIHEDEKCIYEHEVARSNENDLETLLGNLRDVQSRVNNFLTTLIERRDVSGGAQNTSNRATSSDDESISDEEWKEAGDEVEVNPKK